MLEKHWPEVPRFDDIRALTGLPHVDVLCGGFPCQDVSNAGKRAGIKEGNRSGLWLEYARLISEIKPKAIIIENVSALRGRGLARVLADLAARGYDAEWDCIPAAAVGAPHRRDRIFIIANTNSLKLRQQPGRQQWQGGADTVLSPGDGATGLVANTHSGGFALQRGCGVLDSKRTTLGDDADGCGRAPEVADAGRAPRGPETGHAVTGAGGEAVQSGQEEPRRCGPLGGWPQTTRSDWWEFEPPVGRVANGVPRRVDRLKALGNAVVPQVAEHIGRLVIEALGC